MPKILLISLGLIVLSNVKAAEVDEFTRRDEALNDVSGVINKKANESVAKVITKLNKNDDSCNEKHLYSNLRKYFGNHLRGKFTKYIIKSDEVEKRHIPVDESVYRDWNTFTGFILGNPLYKKTGIAISDVMRVGDFEIGTDKFEHLFGRGWLYFNKHYLKEKSIESTLRFGTYQEKFILGGAFIETGVLSYGDLSANFNGMRFWNHILLKEDDVLGKEYNLGPYIKCEDNQWKQVAEIDFRNYIDLAFDESVNCSQFSTASGLEKFEKELEKLNATCQMTAEQYQMLSKKYGQFSDWILNNKGNSKVKYTENK